MIFDAGCLRSGSSRERCHRIIEICYTNGNLENFFFPLITWNSPLWNGGMCLISSYCVVNVVIPACG